jgi:hypothetical protein
MLMVLITLLILSLLGTTLISLAFTNYKMKLVNSKVKKNFYFAEAGLEEAYGIIGEIIDEAIEEGNTEVENFMTEFSFEEELEKELNGEDSPYINEEGNLDEEAVKKEQNRIFQESYKRKIENEIVNRLEESSDYKMSYQDIVPVIEISPETVEFHEDTMDIEITSTFIHENIEKKISAEFEITVPEYNEPYYLKETVSKVPKSIVWEKIIAANGDLEIMGGKTQINGDVYVLGSDDINNGIITLNDNSELFINGTVATNEDVKIASSNSKIVISGDIYSRNALIQKNSQNSSISVDGNVHTKDDLELNGKSSDIEINGGYFGISDGSMGSGPDTSSSIVINSEDLGEGSSLTINGDVVIPGTAYITTNVGKYQTGESISIKGNYKAYMYPITIAEAEDWKNGSLKKDNVVFDYFNPLILVSKFKDGRNLLYEDKSKYFELYYKEYGEEGMYSLNGITITPGEKFIHIGAIVSNGSVHGTPEFELQELSEILNKKNEEFNINVNRMGLESEGNQITVPDVIRFDNIQKVSRLDNNTLILLDNSNTNYALMGQGSMEELIPQETNKIDVTDLDLIKGIIIIKGKLYLSGDINFKGTIITEDDVIIAGVNNVTLTHDENVIARIIAENNLEDIFNELYYTENVYIETEAELGKGTVENKILKDKLIKIKGWSIDN